MRYWIATFLPCIFRTMAACSVIWLVTPTLAQRAQPISPAQFDPSDVYFQGYLASRNAEQLEATGDYIRAMEKYRRADELFASVRQYYPDWKPDMVKLRTEKTNEAISKVQDKALKQLNKNRNAVAELEGGTPQPGKITITPSPIEKPPKANVLTVDPVAQRRLEDAEAEVKRLRELMANNNHNNSNLESKLKAAEVDANALRAQLASAPAQSEVKALNEQIQNLEQERQAMAQSLSQSRSGLDNAMTRITALEQELAAAKQTSADLNRNLKVQSDASNQVVSGQRLQLLALEKELQKKSNELAAANNQIASLRLELKESQEGFSEIQKERDSLLIERDQMAAVLKLNDGGRIQPLIDQNMALQKNLREAEEKIKRLYLESNADKDSITEALRDLAVAKSQINRLHQEKQEQDKRLAELESRLKEEEQALAKGDATADPTEVNTLREIIKHQLRMQTRRRQARDLLVDAAKDLSTQDPRLTEAVALFDSGEIALTPEEQKLIADGQVDHEFVSPVALTRNSDIRNIDELNRDISVFENTARKSFLAGRLMPTRELYEMILDKNPGHTPTLCKIGVVYLKLNDPDAAVNSFRRAAELDNQNPYALRMLAYSLMKIDNLKSAEEAAQKSVELAPDDAKSQMLLATICYRIGRSNDAESHFKGAINADPLPSDPYYNLALIYSESGKWEKAKQYYQQALERGAVPDRELEDLLIKH